MSRMMPRLELSRSQILCFRRRVGSLDERLPAGAKSLRLAAWAGLQDSMPRAALLSIHARVEHTASATWEHPSLTQLWGPRFSAYVVAAKDLAVFSLGRLPDHGPRRERARDTAARLHAFLLVGWILHVNLEVSEHLISGSGRTDIDPIQAHVMPSPNSD